MSSQKTSPFGEFDLIPRQAKKDKFYVILCVALLFLGITGTACWFLYLQNQSNKQIYAIDNKSNIFTLQAVDEDRPTEAIKHYELFHQFFFDLPPDGRLIQNRISNALNLVGNDGLVYVNTLKENNYYNNLVASNITQQLVIDSTVISDTYPYKVALFGKLYIIRASSVTERSLVTRGQLRNTQRSSTNGYGFLIERWQIVENKDLKTYERN